jgi:fructose/tagatose bisphosphate aldolase
VKPSKFLGRTQQAIFHTIESVPIPICLHLTTAPKWTIAKPAPTGYTNIMIDASASPRENIRQTKEVVDYCHSIGNISVEGELGTVGGVEDQIKVAEMKRVSDPEQAVEFVSVRAGYLRSCHRHCTRRIQDQESEDRL